ncbi:ADP-ribose pyrophosphatase [Corynebacterium pseudopelargi]|uniref:ADP-ribose pyrophosphatase n=1 Tax=Corynebacterium pseudopelargi TaxID=2080757 RepID=A0A3G6IUC5_9CORY|nr:NUDIX hydrolase [Corynebacterium pseudopelargi]AZA09351.1 ADP-ribose pyrophosphatase [Corynebacterium pseudopelargi]
MADKHFEVVESEILLEAPILALRRDSVRMPDGGVAAREIVEHFGAVAILALNAQNQVAMVQQYRHSVGQRLWELPAGLLDIAQEDPLECAKRELQEEAGLAAQRWEVLSDIVTSPGFAEESIRIYLARDLKEVERPEAHDEEADMDFAWVDLTKAVAKVLSGEIVNATAVAGILAANQVMAHQGTTRPVDAAFDLRPTHLAQRRSEQGIKPDMKQI